jgi:hypothetical protein
MNYQEAKKLFSKKRKGKEFPVTEEDQIEKNTIELEKEVTLEKVNKSFTINLCSVPIVTILPNGLFRLTTNGIFTKVVKSKMEKYSPVRLKEADGWWFVVNKLNKILSVFYERILINKDGKPTTKISAKNPLFKKINVILDELIKKTSDYTIREAMREKCAENELTKLVRLTTFTPRQIKVNYFYIQQLLKNILFNKSIRSYNAYINIKDNTVKSKIPLLKTCFISYITSMLKFILKRTRSNKCLTRR